MELRAATVVVTGASSGIGAAAARQFAERGATVAVLARSAPRLDDLVAAIESGGGRAHAYPVDLSDLGAVASTAKELLADLGPVDVLVNNAGAGCWLAIDETDPHEALEMITVPYVGAFAITHHLVKSMIERGSGLIVNVTSPAAFIPMPGSAAYSVARGAMRHFADALNADLRGTGVTACLVTAGEVESDYWQNNPGARGRVPGISQLFGTLSTDEAAAAIIRAATTGRSVTVPRRLDAALAVFSVAPWPLTRLTSITGWKRGREPAE